MRGNSKDNDWVRWKEIHLEVWLERLTVVMLEMHWEERMELNWGMNLERMKGSLLVENLVCRMG